MKTTIIDENKSPEPEQEIKKKHLANIKLSESGKAINIHIFNPEKFLVIPMQEITKSIIGKVYSYPDGEPEIVGEIHSPKNGKKCYIIKFPTEMFYIKATYIQLLLSGSRLTLNIFEGDCNGKN